MAFSRSASDLRVDLVIYSVVGCAVCLKLKELVYQACNTGNFEQLVTSECRFVGLNSGHKHQEAQENSLQIECFGSADFSQVTKIKPRVFPTVIAFVASRPKAGWEGFAIMAPSEVQFESVMEVLNEAAALANSIEEL